MTLKVTQPESPSRRVPGSDPDPDPENVTGRALVCSDPEMCMGRGGIRKFYLGPKKFAKNNC